VNHSFTKAMLFFVAGNILANYQTKSITAVRGVRFRLPISGLLWMAGFLAITGTPPFGPFLSEFTILRAAFEQGYGGVGVVCLALLAMIFIGMATAMLGMAQGRPHDQAEAVPSRETVFSILPPAVLGALVLLLGLYIPAGLNEALHEATVLLGGAP
jgi:hydrogenase-4 component F